MKNPVYHSSSTKGLRKLEPRISTHKQPWVYATKDLATSAMFIGRNYDLICQIGVDRKPYIYERFEGALEYGFANQSGSIYMLDGSLFKEGKTSFSAEVVSEVPVDVIDEIPVDNVLDFLFQLEREGKLAIYRYPNTPDGLTNDKEDVIERVVSWTSGPDSPVIEMALKLNFEIDLGAGNYLLYLR